MAERSAPESADLTGLEFAGHLFVALTGPERSPGYDHLTEVWRRCAEILGIGTPIEALGLPAVLPTTPDLLPPGSGPVAAAQRPGAEVRQAFVYREHDLLCLSAMLVARGPDEGWSELERDWARVVGAPDDLPLGEARLLLGQRRGRARWLRGPTRVPLGRRVPARRRPGRRAATAVVTGDGLAVRELSPAGDDRSRRRLVVTAPPGDGDRLGSWAWAAGRPEPAPFARYLMHAAILRYELRVWLAGQHFRQLRHRADATLGELLPALAAEPDGSPGRWNGYARRLDLLVADEAGLVGAAAQLRGMRRTVQIASANMAQAVRTEEPGSAYGGFDPFADDRDLAVWFEQQLDDDVEYLEAALHRAGTVGALLDQSVQRWEARRRERLVLVQTAVLGAVVMVLTATQAFQYRVPLPGPVQPAVIATLGAVTFSLPLVVVRLTFARRGGTTVSLERLGLASLVAAVVWTALSWASHRVWPGVADWWWTGAAVVVAFALTWVGMSLARRWSVREIQQARRTPMKE
ncbi:BN6_48550 family protein [Micromonospora sp. NBC_01699]|uniref:CATRA conflict system CASPASE/TPR repeat-associated protein n=1 Tax=Micromonospora sp. NBC_01699 TaxID=2975984 RepID=UPI002E3706C8|nr:CATRA conflict system CASPASE/TPR repeat-associated protein [Micromonospora sp. NBC_01699]